MKKFSQKNRSEQEIAGYRAVLQTIHDNYEYIVPTSNVILQLYQERYSFVGNSARYKTQDNQITEIDSEGNERIRFSPTAAFETKESMERLTGNFLAANKKNEIDNLILIPMFILDFLCIHPFDDGNGRMSRLLTLLLYYRSDLVVEKYISLEKLIEESKETYYEVLQESSKYWQEEKNNYELFIKYYLGVLLKAYSEFENRVAHLRYRKLSKPDRIKAIIERHIGKISKKEIMEQVPDISQTTVERTLVDLQRKDFIKKVGSGQATQYVKIKDE